MRLSIELFGYELTFGPAAEVDDEPEFEPYQDAGSTSAYPIGFAQTPHPGWEKSLNTWDEPSEGDEDV